jgi:hypothetical protein
MKRLALTLLVCNATYLLPHQPEIESSSASASTPLPTRVAGILHVGQIKPEQPLPMFLEESLTYHRVDGHGGKGPSTTTSVTCQLKWDEATQSYMSTRPVIVPSQPLKE